MSLGDLISELKRRRVFRVLVGYGVFAFGVLQAIEPVMHGLHWPEVVLTYVVFGLVVGFPVAVTLAWVFDIKGGRIVWTASAPEGLRGVRVGLLLLVVCTLASALIVVRYLALRTAFPSADELLRRRLDAIPPASDIHAPPSIAVLPFLNMTPDKEQEYFSDGLAEEVLNLLAHVPQLRVIARASSFAFKGKPMEIAEIATKLRVSNLLEGSVRKSGAVLRVTAQLIRASDSSQLWSATYDRELTDVFRVQDEIAAAVVAALKLKLLPAGQLRSGSRSPNLEAYDHYLVARELYGRANPDGYRGAVSAFQQTLALDPGYAAAYVGLAAAEVFVADYAETAEENAAHKQGAIAAAEKAIELAPDLADAWAQRGWIRSNISWDWAGARADFERALAIEPANSIVLARYPQLLGSLGKLPEAIACLRRATELNPWASGVWGNLGYYLAVAGQLADSRQALERALAINPKGSFARSNLAMTTLLEGRAQEAIPIFEQAGDFFSLVGVALAQHSLGHPAESERALERLIAKYAHDAPCQIAEVYAWRGEKDKAFAWLQRAYTEHDGGLSDIKVDPLLVSLRSDPRFAVLVKQMGLPE